MSEKPPAKTGASRDGEAAGPVLEFNINSFRRLFVTLAAIRAVLQHPDYDDAKKVEIIRQYAAAAIGINEGDAG